MIPRNPDRTRDRSRSQNRSRMWQSPQVKRADSSISVNDLGKEGSSSQTSDQQCTSWINSSQMDAANRDKNHYRRSRSRSRPLSRAIETAKGTTSKVTSLSESRMDFSEPKVGTGWSCLESRHRTIPASPMPNSYCVSRRDPAISPCEITTPTQGDNVRKRTMEFAFAEGARKVQKLSATSRHHLAINVVPSSPKSPSPTLPMLSAETRNISSAYCKSQTSDRRGGDGLLSEVDVFAFSPLNCDIIPATSSTVLNSSFNSFPESGSPSVRTLAMDTRPARRIPVTERLKINHEKHKPSSDELPRFTRDSEALGTERNSSFDNTLDPNNIDHENFKNTIVTVASVQQASTNKKCFDKDHCDADHEIISFGHIHQVDEHQFKSDVLQHFDEDLTISHHRILEVAEGKKTNSIDYKNDNEVNAPSNKKCFEFEDEEDFYDALEDLPDDTQKSKSEAKTGNRRCTIF